MDTEDIGVDDEVTRQEYKRRGRGHLERDAEKKAQEYESFDESRSGPLRSVEGWIVFVSNVHEEAQEDDILDKFGEFGHVKNIHVNLDRRTGFVKGYALIEYAEQSEARTAIAEMHQQNLFGQSIAVDWAFRDTSGRTPSRRYSR